MKDEKLLERAAECFDTQIFIHGANFTRQSYINMLVSFSKSEREKAYAKCQAVIDDQIEEIKSLKYRLDYGTKKE